MEHQRSKLSGELAPSLPVEKQTELKVSKEIDHFTQSPEKRLYIRAETGTGKTTAIVKLAQSRANERIAIIVPYSEQVDSLWHKLDGRCDVCGWTEAHDMASGSTSAPRFEPFKKSYRTELRSARVVIVTHQFIGKGNRELLGKRDLLMIDELPTWAKFAEISGTDIAEAVETARVNALPIRDGLIQLQTWYSSHRPANPNTLLSNAELEGFGLCASDLQEAANTHAKLRPIASLATGALNSRALIQQTPNYSAESGDSIRLTVINDDPTKKDKRIIFSATPHLGGYQLGTPKAPEEPLIHVDYSNLEIVKLRKRPIDAACLMEADRDKTRA